MPSIPSRRSSLVDSLHITARRSIRSLSVCDVGDLTSLSQIRKDAIFVEIREGHRVNFIFPSSLEVHTPSISVPRQSTSSKAHSYRSLRHKEPTPFLVRLSSIKSEFDTTRDKEKIPLFVPSQIIKPAASRLMIPERQSSRLAPEAALRVGDGADNEHFNRKENRSKEALSEASDWSTTAQFEAPKQEAFQPESETCVAPDLSLTLIQESQAERGKSSESRRGNQGRATPSGPAEAERLTGGLISTSHGSDRGSRPFQSCNAYFQRVKHFWRGSGANLKSVRRE